MNVHDYMRRLGDLLAVTENIIKERDEARREACESANEIERLRAERDEARRMACRCSSSSGSASESLEEAQLRGWDCFKEETP